jgi:hypothetical protein
VLVVEHNAEVAWSVGERYTASPWCIEKGIEQPAALAAPQDARERLPERQRSGRSPACRLGKEQRRSLIRIKLELEPVDARQSSPPAFASHFDNIAARRQPYGP